MHAAVSLTMLEQTDACRKLLLSSMAGVVAALALLGLAFYLAEHDSPAVVLSQSTCQAQDISDCTSCLHKVCKV